MPQAPKDPFIDVEVRATPKGDSCDFVVKFGFGRAPDVRRQLPGGGNVTVDLRPPRVTEVAFSREEFYGDSTSGHSLEQLLGKELMQLLRPVVSEGWQTMKVGIGYVLDPQKQADIIERLEAFGRSTGRQQTFEHLGGRSLAAPEVV